MFFSLFDTTKRLISNDFVDRTIQDAAIQRAIGAEKPTWVQYFQQPVNSRMEHHQCLTYRVDELTLVQSIYKKDRLHFMEFKTELGTMSRLTLCKAWACCCQLMDFLQPVLSTLRNDFNLGNKHFDVVFGNRHPLSMSGHFMKAWGCLATIEIAMWQLNLWEEQHILPDAWAPVDLEEWMRIGECLEQYSERLTNEPPSKISCTFVLAAEWALQLYAAGYNPVWWDIAEEVFPGQGLPIHYRLPLGLPIHDDEIRLRKWSEAKDASKPLRAGKDGEEDGAVVTEIEGGAAGRVEKDEEPELEGGKGVMLLSPWNNGDPATSSLRSRHKGQSETSPDICKLGKQSNGTAGLKEAQKTSKGDEVGEGENGVKGGEEGGEAMVTGKQKKNLRRKERREKKEKKGNDMS